MNKISIVGGGLSGCEAALQAAKRGIKVDLYEMRPIVSTGAHQTDKLAEIVCSNSLGSDLANRPAGLLMHELHLLDSQLLKIARSCKIPAGHALAIDREEFSARITNLINDHPLITLHRQEVTEIPDGICIIASGPLTSQKLAQSIATLTLTDNLFFYDAVAPIIEFESINMDIAFWGSRYGRGTQPKGDYINCPFQEDSYLSFVNALTHAQRVELKGFEKDINSGVRAGKSQFFEGCLPVEVMAARGTRTLAFGPLRPVGLTNPHDGSKPYAVVQLRQDDLLAESFNLVGFQTNLLFSEQKRIFRMIPGLEQAKFLRYGQMHRNTFIHSPSLLSPLFNFAGNPNLYFAGQVTGLEGYLANIASGLYTGMNIARQLANKPPVIFPKTTMIGALFDYVTCYPGDNFQPMKANFGLLPPLPEKVRPKKDRFEAFSARAILDMEQSIKHNEI